MISFKQFLQIINLEDVNPDYLRFPGSTSAGALRREMRREIEHFKNLPHDDPAAYPDDWTADEKYRAELKKKGRQLQVSKYTKKFKQLYAEQTVVEDVDTALQNKSDATGVPVRFLRAVYNRGLAAWRTGHRPGVAQHQWAMGRVNSFLVGGPAREADADIWDQVAKNK